MRFTKYSEGLFLQGLQKACFVCLVPFILCCPCLCWTPSCYPALSAQISAEDLEATQSKSTCDTQSESCHSPAHANEQKLKGTSHARAHTHAYSCPRMPPSHALEEFHLKIEEDDVCLDTPRMHIPPARTRGLPAARGHPDQHSEMALLGILRAKNHLCAPSAHRGLLAMLQSTFSLKVPVPACTHGTHRFIPGRLSLQTNHSLLRGEMLHARTPQKPYNAHARSAVHFPPTHLPPLLYEHRKGRGAEGGKRKKEKTRIASFGLKLGQDIASLPRVIPSLVAIAKPLEILLRNVPLHGTPFLL